MPIQLEFQEAAGEQSAIDVVCAVALAAVDLDRHPGYAEFTAGDVTVERSDAERIVLSTDNRWAASAIRATLRRAGYAVEADRGNETTTVTVWATSASEDESQPELNLANERDDYGRTTFLLEGPDGTVEQQCGSGGHNDLIVHARHPFPGSVRSECARHGAGCWIRSDWPWEKRTVRSGIQSVVAEAGSAWKVSSEAESLMRDIYLRHIHLTRRTGSAPAFHLAKAPTAKTLASTVTTRKISPQPAAPVPRQVDVIRDLSDFEGAA